MSQRDAYSRCMDSVQRRARALVGGELSPRTAESHRRRMVRADVQATDLARLLGEIREEAHSTMLQEMQRRLCADGTLLDRNGLRRKYAPEVKL